MASRFPDSRDPRFPRDRSPPRYAERRSSGPYGGGYPPRNSDSGGRPHVDPGGGFQPSSRDVPRGPKALVEQPRGPSAGGPSIVPSGPRESRGRGFPGRGEGREGRELRDQPPLSDGRERWRAADREREFDRRDRRPSPRGRSPVRDLRDSRDYVPRDIDINRARRNSRDGPPSAGSNYSDPPPGSATSYRGGFSRGRGRPEWGDFRGRGRGHFHEERDQRDFRQRSRSRGPPLRRDRDPIRDEREPDRRDDRRFERREEERRPYDSYKGQARPLESRNLDPRHASTSGTSTGPSTPHIYSGPSTHPSVSERLAPEPIREDSYSRRSSIATDSIGSKDIRREPDKPDFLANRAESSRDRYAPRPASPPPQAPQVPAFGSVSARPATFTSLASNVWKNPHLDTKPTAQPPISKPAPSIPTAPSAALTSSVPSAPSAQSVQSAPLPSSIPSASVPVLVPPTAPKSQPTVPTGLSTLPPTGPKATRILERAAAESQDVRTSLIEQPRNEAPPSRPAAAPISHPSLPVAESIEQKPPMLPTAASPPLGPSPKPRAPPTGPQASLRPNMSPSQGFGRIPQVPFPARDVSPNAIPIGPRASTSINTSPNSVGTNIPTGPKAERSQTMGARPSMFGGPDRPPFPAPRAPMVGGPSKNPQWIRPGVTPSYRPPVIPTKREFISDDKDRIIGSAPKAPKIEVAAGNTEVRLWDVPRPELALVDQVKRDVERHSENAPGTRSTQSSPRMAKLDTRRFSDVSMAEASPQIEKPPISATSSAPEMMEDSDEDLDLDEADFAESEARFKKEKTILEAKLVDLSARSLRATTPLEEIILLASITTEHLDLPETEDVEEKTVSPNTHQRSADLLPAELLTPKAEELEDVVMEDAQILRTKREVSVDRESTPDLSSLPYLGKGPPTPLSDPDQECSTPPKDTIHAVRESLLEERAAEEESQDMLEEKYYFAYKAWRLHVQELDDKREQEEKEQRQLSAEPGPKATTPDIATAATPTIPELGRRAHKFSSEYEIQLVLKESMKDAEEAQARKEREAKRSNADPEREARIPEEITEYEAQRRRFIDTNFQRQPGQGIFVFHYEPPEDDFTPEEHKIMVQHYKDQYAKKWGKLAEVLSEKLQSNRTYKDCINHYYATKWAKEYKGRARKLKGVRRPRGGGGAGRGRASATAAERPDLYDNDMPTPLSSSVTDSGRPRRAAAPTFGAESEIEAVTPAPTPGRLRGRQDNVADGAAEKAGKRQKMQKEKVGRKPRNQPLAAAPAGSPVKIDKKEKLPGVKTEEAYGRAQSIEEARLPSNLQPSQCLEEPKVFSEDMLGQTGTGVAMAERPKPQASQRAGPSSYWSVVEQTDFRRYIAHFGTDFTAIANHMRTKTQTMVNHDFLFSYPHPDPFYVPSPNTTSPG